MSKVAFIPKEKIGKLPEAMASFGLERFRGKEVLVKLHMGEKGNKWYVDPAIVKTVCDELKKVNAKPFLFDTIPAYRGGRDTKEKYLQTAKSHGFDKVGCPIIIGNEGPYVSIDGKKFEVAKELFNSKFIVAISHVKGHPIPGMGAAIKNFGMGGLSNSSKSFIHDGGKPVLKKEKCQLCGTCEKVCISGHIYGKKAIKVSDDWCVNYSCCLGCGHCVKECPYGALSYRIDDFNLLLAMGAKACVQNKNLLYINVALKITKFCDCGSNSLPIISDDVGILVSNDPVSIDAASADLVEKKMGKTFKEIWGTDAMDQVRCAEKIGMGSAKYELIKVK